MRQIATILFIFLLVFTFLGTAVGQVIVEQDFDSANSWNYSSDVAYFSHQGSNTNNNVYPSPDGWSGDGFFGIIDISSASGLNLSEFSSNLLGEKDLDDEGDFGTSGFANITFSQIDISSYENVEISFDYQVVGYNANNDDAKYEVYHDGVGQGEVFLLDGGTNDTDASGTETISIPNNVNSVELVISISNNGNDGFSGFDNFLLAESTVEPEPTNHASNFSASSSSISSIDLSWTDATAGTAPENYLIVIRESDSFSSPTDGVQQSDDTNLSDGNGALNVSQGMESATFSDLQSNTQYYFEIYPYTNLGTYIDYKTDGSVPSASVSTLEKPDLVLNEIFADPANDSSGDANNDGTRSSDDDEFLEFVNNSSNDLDISGWTVSVGSTEQHTFSSDPATILGPNQAVVIFGGGDPSGAFGGSIVQTTGSLGLSNSGETITVKNGNNTLIEFTYSGASDQSETRSPDLNGNFENHTTSDEDDNSAYSPGTRIDGTFFQQSENLSITFDGIEGWRMISAPTSGNSYHDLLEELWTQGTSGADYSGGEPNVMSFDGTNFSAVGDLQSDIMNNGEGFIVYVYSDDDFDQSPTDNGFPKTLNLTGVPRTGYVEAPLNSESETFSLVGNPYNHSIDWDDLRKSDLTGTVYVYDHSYGNISEDDIDESNVGGGYRTWNSNEVGSLTGGVIAPFQGFWVQNSGSSPSLTFEESDQTTGGTFYTKENKDVISIRLRSQMENMFSESFLSFSGSGKIGHDNYDALKLSPLDFRNYISLSTEVEGTQMDINNLPAELYNPIKIPLHVQAFKALNSGWAEMGGKITLSWPEMNNIPSEWEITLTDTQLNRTIDLISASQYVFKAEGSRTKIQGKKPFNPLNPKPFQKEKAVSDARFLITINPNVPDGMINDDIPDQFTLEQNYPNPFNPTTNIKFEIAETSNVSLNVYNIMGQRVATLVNEVKAPGTYEITWDAREMASGIYYYRLRAGGVVFNRQMTLIK